MRTRSTIIWLIILFLLGGSAYYYEFVIEKERIEAEEEAKKVFQFEAFQIQELKFTRKGKTIHCLKRDKDVWDIIEPVKTLADESVVTDVLNGLVAARIDRVIAEKIEDPKVFGFDNPEYDIEFKSKDKTFHLILGKKNPTDYFFYAKYADQDKLFLVPFGISYNLNKDLFEFRDKAVLRVNIKETSVLELESPDGVVRLVKQENGDWKVLQPKVVDAGKNEVDKYITSISILRATKFLEKDESKTAGLDSPSLTIRLTVGKDKTVKSLIFGKKEKDKYFARRGLSNEIFQLEGVKVDNLKYKADDFRSKKIFSFDKEDVQAIELNHSEVSLILKKTKDNWELEKPEPGPAKNVFVSELLSDIIDLRVEEFLNDSANTGYGFDKPSLKVLLRLKAEKEVSFLVGNQKDDNVYVRVGSQSYLVSASDVEQIKIDPAHFKKDIKKKDTEK